MRRVSKGESFSETLQIDVYAERPDFLHQHVEGLRHSRVDLVVALDDVFVNLGAAVDVVGFDREHLLQRVRGAVGFEGPDFHLAESLSAELRLAAERLLGHQTVRTRRARMHLVVHQVVELQHVHETYGHLPVEGVAGTAVVQAHLASARQTRRLKHLLDLVLGGTVEHGGRKRHSLPQVPCQGDHIVVGEYAQVLGLAALVVDAAEELAQLRGLGARLQHLADFQSQALGCPTQMGFENLPDVHARRHAQRIEHDVDRRAVGHARHVLDRHDLGDDALVSVAAGHLVARLQAPLHCDVDLHHLLHAGRKLVALRQFLLLCLERRVEPHPGLGETFLQVLQLLSGVLVCQADFEPVVALDTLQVGFRDLGPTDELLRPLVGGLADEQALHPLEGVALDDAHLVGEVLLVALELLVDYLRGALVALDPFPGEHLHINHRSGDSGGHAQARVLHVGSLLAEDRAKQFFLGRELGLALGRHLAHQNVARLDFGSDIYDTGLVKPRELRLRKVRNVACDLLGPELGVACHYRQLLDVDRGIAVIRHDALGNQDRILEIETVPGHEGDQHVLPQRELAHVGRGTVGHHVALGDALARLHQRRLIDVGVLVRPRVFHQVVNIDAHVSRDGFGVVDAHHDPARIDVIDHAAAQRLNRRARVHRDSALDPRADERFLRPKARHRLALHVRAHQRAVGVVMLEEGDERGRYRNDLRGGHVHVLDAVGGRQREFVLEATGNQAIDELAVLVDLRIRLRNDEVAFLDRGKKVNLARDFSVYDLPVGRLQKPVPVGAGEERERVDQADVRAFRRLDGADPAIVSRVHVAHLEARALPGEAPRPQGRYAPLVRDFRKRIRLVHELRQLARAEKLLDRGGDGLRVDEIVRHEIFGLRLREAFFHRALDANQARAELVLGEFAHGAHAPVAEMVDVVDLPASVAQFHEDSHHGEDIVVRQRPEAFGSLRAHPGIKPAQPGGGLFLDLLGVGAAVELHAADRRKVIAVLRVEQAVEQGFDRIFRGRLAGAHHAIDGDARRALIGGFVDLQRLRDVSALVEVVGVDGFDRLDARFAQLRKQGFGDFVVGVGEYLAGFFVDDVVRERTSYQEFVRYRHPLHSRGFHVANVLAGDALVLLHDRLARLVDEVETRDFAAQALGHQLELIAALGELEGVEIVERREDGVGSHADRLEQDRHRHLAPAVDAKIEVVLGVVFEVEPRAAVRDDARRKEQLPRRVCLAAIVLEEHARRAVQLADDHALGAVDDERARGGHERNLAHVHFLFLDLLHRGLGGFLVHDGEAHLGAQWARVGQPALLALLDVEGRLAERVADEFEPRVPRVAGDGEDRGERRLQAFVLAFFRQHCRLQESRVGIELGRQKKRHAQNARALGEALANAFFLGG